MYLEFLYFSVVLLERPVVEKNGSITGLQMKIIYNITEVCKIYIMKYNL